MSITSVRVGVAAILFAFAAIFISSLPSTALATVTVNAPTLNGTTTVTVAPGAIIAVQVSVTTTASEDWESTSYRIGSTGNYTCVDTTNFTSSGTHTATFNVTAPATEGTYNFEVRAHGSQGNSVNNNCSGNGLIDSRVVTGAITVVVAPPPPSCPAYTPVAGNLITNPSFEDATPQNGWLTNSFGTNDAAFSIATGHSGANCNGAQVSIISYADGDAKWIHTAIPVTAGQFYTFSTWYKSTTETNLFLYYVPTGGNPATPTIEFLATLPASADWTQATRSFTAATSGTLIVAQVLQSTGTLTTDDYSLVSNVQPQFETGIITLTFDDGWTSAFQSIMEAGVLGNYKSTHYIYSDGMNQVHGPSFINATQVKALFDAGHEIGGHSKTHANLTDPGVDLNEEIDGNKTALEDVVGVGNVTTFAYPHGAYNSTVIQAIQNAGYIAARSVENNFNTPSTDKFTLAIQRVHSNTTINDIRSWIDQAQAQKTWLILMFHEVVSNQATDCLGIVPPGQVGECTSRAIVQEMTDYLSQNQACVLTVAQVITNTPCPQTPPPPPADTTAPVIITPSSPLIVTATSSNSIMADVTYSVSATDTEPANPAVSCSPASGTMFALGNTTVNCSSTDAAGNTANASFTVTVVAPAPVNNSPVANPQSVSMNENSSLSITLTGSDLDNDTLVFATTSNPTNGTLSGTAPNLIYTPTADFVGTDSFTFSVGDGEATSTATITISSGGGGGGGGGVVLGLIGTVNTNPTGGQVLGAATGLTDAQIESILNLLRSFDADQSVIDNVNKALRGQASSIGGKFIFTRTLQTGSTGNDVMELQKRLIAEGHLKIAAPTTYFGSLTRAAVILYQKAKGLPQVGIVGPQTRAELNK
jgi:peptidoglycan/xylan/chitin deacetylase (PgdA/CDA1 family)